jgi:hypothetical protein
VAATKLKDTRSPLKVDEGRKDVVESAAFEASTKLASEEDEKRVVGEQAKHSSDSTPKSTVSSMPGSRDPSRERKRGSRKSSLASHSATSTSANASSSSPVLQQPVAEADGARCKQLLSLMDMLLTDNPLSMCCA